MRLTKRLALALASLMVVVGATVLIKRDYVQVGAYGYLYGYPLVIMDITRNNFAQNIAPENVLRKLRVFPDARFRDVVRPNVDTLYTASFIDMQAGPWVFEIPPGAERYQVFPFMDAWTNVYATLGTRTEGARGGRFLLVGPAWQGEAPAGLTVVRAPTRMVWLIGRTQTNGSTDYSVAHRLQDGLSLTRLTDWQAGQPTRHAPWRPAVNKPAPPVEQIQALSTEAFFTRLSALMVDNPPSAADAEMVAHLAAIGVVPGRPPQWSALEAALVDAGRRIADWKVKREMAKPRQTTEGWVTPPMNLGNYGTDYPVRAVIAMVALGANLPADAIYPNARIDADGQALNGGHRYRLHFPADALPPVNAFWSVTVYDEHDFLVDNPLNRYALGDRDPLRRNADGSLDLLLQAEPPAEEERSNWLPVPANAEFAVTARLYWPKPEALDGRWHMPGIRRVP